MYTYRANPMYLLIVQTCSSTWAKTCRTARDLTGWINSTQVKRSTSHTCARAPQQRRRKTCRECMSQERDGKRATRRRRNDPHRGPRKAGHKTPHKRPTQRTAGPHRKPTDTPPHTDREQHPRHRHTHTHDKNNTPNPQTNTSHKQRRIHIYRNCVAKLVLD